LDVCAQDRAIYFFDVPDEAWLAGVDAQQTGQPTGLVSESSKSFEFEDKEGKVPKHQEAMCGKQSVREEPS